MARGGHHSYYAPDWLRAHCYSTSSREKRRRDARIPKYRPVTSPPWFDREQLEADETERMVFLETVRDHGFALLHGVGLEEAELARG